MMFRKLVTLKLLVAILQGIASEFQPVTENNRVLVGHVFQQLYTRDWFNCIQACNDEPRCISYNYERSAGANGLCELNDCGVEDFCDRDKSLIYSVGFVFQQLRESKLVNGKMCEIDPGYAFHFPHKGTDDYIQIWGMRRLTQFTVCFWMQSNDTTSSRTFLSYAVPNNFNEINIMNCNGFKLEINGEGRSTSASANDGMWHHLCVSWNNTTGFWNFYIDGRQEQHGDALKPGYEIKPNGTLILAQEQDSLGGGFEQRQSFQGMLTNVNMWDHVIPPEKIHDMSQSCLSGEGNVYKWSDFKNGVKGNPRVVIPSPCKSTNV